MSVRNAILTRLGLEGDVALLVDTTPEGAIVLRPAAIYPIGIYSDKHIREFDAADRMDAKTAARLARITAAHNPDGNGKALVRLAAEQQLELVSSRYAWKRRRAISLSNFLNASPNSAV